MKDSKKESWLFNVRTFFLLSMIVILFGYIVVLKAENSKKDLILSSIDNKCFNKSISKR